MVRRRGVVPRQAHNLEAVGSNPTAATKSKRTRPCPWCGKRLAASTKTKWRNNLARHHRACSVYQAKWLAISTDLVSRVLDWMTSGLTPTEELERLAAQSEGRMKDVMELKRMYGL